LQARSSPTAALRAALRTIRGLAVGALLAGLLACQSTPEAQRAAAHPAHEGTNAILWMQTAPEYRAATIQAFRSAAVHLERGVADPTWTAAPEQAGDFGQLPPAVILDMDEAIVRSDGFQAWLVANDRPYRLDDWNAWVRSETAEAVPGALDYVRRARELGVKPFYVTNRTAEVEAASLATLRKLGFPVEHGAEDLLTQDERPEWGTDKSSRRAVVARTHRVVQIVGDNLNDFTSGAHASVAERLALAERYAGYWGARWILTPNPSYGGWEGALFDYDYGLSREEIRERKLRHLRPWR